MSNYTYQVVGKRNPIIILNNGSEEYVIQTIGDPHLGRNFRNNLRHRLGDREQSIKDSFIGLLHKPSSLTVIVGDLLDKVCITNEWFNFTLQEIERACRSNPTKQYIILNGNHDEVKDKGRVSSFKLLETYFKSTDLPNLIFVSDSCIHHSLSDFSTSLFFTNYDPFNSLDNLLKVSDLPVSDNKIKIAFGHFDVESYGDSKFINREIPNILVEHFNVIVTGHFHKPSNKVLDKNHIIVTGSMQPYSFGEEIKEDGTLYTTIPILELKTILDNDSEVFCNSHVKILYTDGEDFLPPFNCYSFVYKNITVKDKTNFEFKSSEVLSFSSLFLEALSTLKDENNSEYVDSIEQVFLEKNYESN